MVELDGIEPSVGLLVKALPTSPRIAPHNTKGQRPYGLKWMLAFIFHKHPKLYINFDVKSNIKLFCCITFLWYLVNAERTWRWSFLGYQSKDEGRPVQAWFDRLPVEARDEITDLLQALQVVTARLWRAPEFKPLPGAGGISELRPPAIRCDAGVFVYRIYGFFGPNKREYTLLHGTLKTVRNDFYGKRIARNRLDRLNRGDPRVTVHKFDFEGWLDTEIP